MLKRYKIKHIFLLIILLFSFSSCDFTTAEQNFMKANEYADNKNYKRAIIELNKAISKKRNYRRALFNRALYKNEINDLSGAFKDYKEIIGFTNCTECGYQIAVILNKNKQYESAIEVLNSTLKTKGVVEHDAIFNPNIQFFNDDSDSDYNVNEENIYFERGLSHLKSKHYKKAISDFNKTNEFEYYKNEGYYNIGEAFLGLKDTIRACENYQKSAELKNKEAMIRINEFCNESIN
jgi:tetratricopeptide (TPR) repeat protein